ncbi:MAG: hypothetical protein JXA78_19585 [Anaerolineales bacterium]|nr:hypothetical protein [Anaerolineales bacterium]
MAKISSYLSDAWGTVKEIDLRPLREQALRGVKIAIVGAPGSGRSTLAEQMRRDPSRPQAESDAPIWILDLDSALQVKGADLVILMMDSRKTDSSQEQELVRGWYNSGQKVLTFINQFEEPGESTAISPWSSRVKRRVIWGSVLDSDLLVKQLASVVIELLPDHLLSLGRYFPLFRVPVAHYLINDTCFTNAAYALSTGLAETVAVLDIPIAVTDMVVMSKNQAFLVYKLGLALGFSTRWQDYVAEFGSVLGGGFLWRELARTLIGLIPVWGIIPKTAIAYSGTYVIGHFILQWYLTGRHLSRKQMQQLYKSAFARGKNVARSLIGKLPRPRLPKPQLSRPRLPRRKRGALPAPVETQTCARCGKISSADASFCQYCGQAFPQKISEEDTGEGQAPPEEENATK